MSIDLDAIRARHAEMRRHLDAQDEAEFSLAAVEAIDDVPALLAELGRLTPDGSTLTGPWVAADGTP